MPAVDVSMLQKFVFVMILARFIFVITSRAGSEDLLGREG